MPSAPLRPCSRPGCGRLTSGRFCELHAAAVEAERGNSAARGYDHRWRAVRLAKLAGEPLCRFCVERGHVTPAVEVDHIDGDSRNNADSNLRPLCKPCHSRRTAVDQSFTRPR